MSDTRSKGVAIAALVCGLVGFLINPLCLVTIATVVLSIVALCSKNQGGKGMAVAGLVCACLQILTELVLGVLTLGISLFI